MKTTTPTAETTKQFCAPLNAVATAKMESLQLELGGKNKTEFIQKLLADYELQKAKVKELQTVAHPFRSELTKSQEIELALLDMLKSDKPITGYAINIIVTAAINAKARAKGQPLIGGKTERTGLNPDTIAKVFELYDTEIVAHRKIYPAPRIK